MATTIQDTCPITDSEHVVIWSVVPQAPPEPGVGDAMMFAGVPEQGECMACGHLSLRDAPGTTSLLS